MLVVDKEGKIFDNRREKERRAEKPNKFGTKQERRMNEDRRKFVQSRGKKRG